MSPMADPLALNGYVKHKRSYGLLLNLRNAQSNALHPFDQYLSGLNLSGLKNFMGH